MHENASRTRGGQFAAAGEPPRRSIAAAQRGAPYLDALCAYAGSEAVRLNVPGHKGGPAASPGARAVFGEAPFDLDVPPLLWGVDGGEAPTPLERSLELAAEHWGAARTWFLTNGASQGNQVACLAIRSLGEQVVVQRSMHSSVIDGLVLAGLLPTFVFPAIDRELGVAHGVTPADLDRALSATPDAAAALVVSPSYFGAVADVGAFAEVAHRRGVPLIVDEAWGSHLGLHPQLPPNALALGADLVVSSTHKMVGSLTQSAMLHLGTGVLAARLEEAVDRAFQIVQSTSASSLLLGSLDGARQQMATQGRRLVEETLEAAARLRAEISRIPGLRIADEDFRLSPGVVAVDPLRIVIDVAGTGESGFSIAAHLRAVEGLDFEVVNHRALVVVLGAAEGMPRFADRLLAALRRLPRSAPGGGPAAIAPVAAELVNRPREAFLAESEVVDVGEAVGRVSAQTLSAYPPGIPNLIPGERIEAEAVEMLLGTIAAGGFVRGAISPDLSTVRVVHGQAS